ncbi:unnamed protein product [Phytophthora lilii]|uniref:Unnamed protein product n=1 Tax=Phytophthora lilii TaxID=2077276 RepID=A0A9W6YKF2_9STRA|nr:unnamed protein product [Phytophthora lilii]
MTRANVVTPATAWFAPTETTRLLDPDVDLKKVSKQLHPAKYASFIALFGTVVRSPDLTQHRTHQGVLMISTHLVLGLAG